MKETAYLLHAALISGWWVRLASSQRFFAAFQFDSIPGTALWAFFSPDILVIAGLSTIRAYLRFAAIEFMVLGAFGYAALYCCNAMVLTASGYLPTGLMLVGLAYNVFLCFHESLFRSSSTGHRWNVAKTFVQIVCIWILTLAAVPYVILDAFDALFVPDFGISLGAGVLLFLCCSVLGLASAFFHGSRWRRHSTSTRSNQHLGCRRALP